MSSVIDVLKDIIIEAQTTNRVLEYDDPLCANLQYIEDMANVAIAKLEENDNITDDQVAFVPRTSS